MKVVTIYVCGGLVQDVQRSRGVPENLRVIVRDYDTDGVDEDDITATDSDGKTYVESEW